MVDLAEKQYHICFCIFGDHYSTAVLCEYKLPAPVSPHITRSTAPEQGLKFMPLVLHEGFMGPATARLSG